MVLCLISCARSEEYILISKAEMPGFIELDEIQYENKFFDQGLMFFSLDSCSHCEMGKQILISIMEKDNINIYHLQINELNDDEKKNFSKFNKQNNIYYQGVPFLFVFKNAKIIKSENNYHKFNDLINAHCRVEKC